jgi:hypothetical protein
MVAGFGSREAQAFLGGMNLTEQQNFAYDAALPGAPKTPAQVAVDQIRSLGANHVILNPRAIMTNPKGSDLLPVTPVSDRSAERARYKRLIDYIHSLGMTVGIRPIFFVVKPDGSFPYIEVLPNGGKKLWWHGNIEPSDPNQWFESFRSYLDIYLLIAKMNHVEEFTMGAELYSMTVGIEDQWFQYPYGFPGRWLDLLHYVRKKIDPATRVMYDINFTDDVVNATGVSASGGELERWRYRLVDLANPSSPAEHQIWQDLVDFWRELDSIGVDMYRSLAGKRDSIPASMGDLVSLLRIRSDQFASQMDNTLVNIEMVTGKHQMAFFKELGYRSMEKGFIDPFYYENGAGTYNGQHQAAAFQAMEESFWGAGFDWFGGGSFWDVGVSPSRNSGPGDTGFSPIGKPETLEILKQIYSR